MTKKMTNSTDIDPQMPNTGPSDAASQSGSGKNDADKQAEVITERGGPKGPEPTRFGDWENNGRCTDF